MMADAPQNAELSAAVKKGMIVDFAMLAVGGALWFVTDNVAWLIGGFVIGSAVFMLLLAQAGAFTRRDDQP